MVWLSDARILDVPSANKKLRIDNFRIARQPDTSQIFSKNLLGLLRFRS